MQCNVLMPSIFQGIQQQFPEEGEREREKAKIGRTNLLQPANLHTSLVVAVYIYLLTICTLARTSCGSFGSSHRKHANFHAQCSLGSF